MRRSADFITYPGTGMWMMVTPTANSSLFLYRSLTPGQLKAFLMPSVPKAPGYRLYWIDQGIGASTLLGVLNGGKSSSATLVTPSLLKRYLKE